MERYFKQLKRSFELPQLRNEYSLDGERSAHMMELFFDLIFVAALSSIGHLFIHPTLQSILAGVILYFAVYRIWSLITKYLIYFFSASYFHRVFVFVAMFPLIFIIGLDNYSDKMNIILLTCSFALSRLSIFFVWRTSVVLNEQTTNLYIRKYAKSESIINLVTAAIFLIPVLNVNIFIPVVVVALVTENIMEAVAYRTNQYIEPMVDYELLKERHVLFLILVWGEGIITAIGTLNFDNSVFPEIFMPISLFIIVYFFFIRAQEEYGLFEYTKDNVASFSRMHMILPLICLTLFQVLGGVANGHGHISFLSKLIIIADLMYITCWHLFSNLDMLNAKDQKKMFKEYLKFDNKLLYIQFIIIVLLYFIENNYLFILAVLVFFIFHSLALPKRYECYKKTI